MRPEWRKESLIAERPTKVMLNRKILAFSLFLIDAITAIRIIYNPAIIVSLLYKSRAYSILNKKAKNEIMLISITIWGTRLLISLGKIDFRSNINAGTAVTHPNVRIILVRL